MAASTLCGKEQKAESQSEGYFAVLPVAEPNAGALQVQGRRDARGTPK